MLKSSDYETRVRNILWSMGLGITDLKLLLTLETLRPVWGNNIESPSDFPSVTGVSDILYKFI